MKLNDEITIKIEEVKMNRRILGKIFIILGIILLIGSLTKLNRR